MNYLKKDKMDVAIFDENDKIIAVTYQLPQTPCEKIECEIVAESSSGKTVWFDGEQYHVADEDKLIKQPCLNEKELIRYLVMGLK